jgi:hypothetical protein
VGGSQSDNNMQAFDRAEANHRRCKRHGCAMLCKIPEGRSCSFGAASPENSPPSYVLSYGNACILLLFQQVMHRKPYSCHLLDVIPPP